MRLKAYRSLLATSCFFAAASPAKASFVEPLVKQTLGSGNYAATYASVDFGGDLHFKPAFNSYHSNTSSGTYQTYSLDVDYEREDYTWVLTGGFTPTVNDYHSRFVGGRVSRDIDFGDDDRRFFKSLTPMAGATQTLHTQQVTTVPVKAGPITILGKTSAAHITQTDVEGSVAVSVPDVTLSMDLPKSVYNQDLARLSVRSAQVTRLAGLNQIIQGFPDFNADERIQFDFLPRLKPYFGFTYTSFKVSLPVAATYTAGLRWSFSAYKTNLSYQRYAQKGQSDVNYFSASFSARFE